MIRLIQQSVGPWPMNSYLLVDDLTGDSAIIDPGAEPEKILQAAEGTRITAILLTHGHPDHTGALQAVRQATGAPVHLHPADAEQFELDYDVALEDGMQIPLGASTIRAIHTPGHTPGATSFDLDDGRILVGDTLFPGGPGKTWSAQEFQTTLETMRTTVFTWPDDTRFFPGHGESSTIGQQRPQYEAFLARGEHEGVWGDVVWGSNE